MMARIRVLSLVTSLLALGSAACNVAPPPVGLARGESLFKTCASCHGEDGGGNPALAAPAIAGLPQWYVEAQLSGFQDGYRGKHANDLPGLRMRPMAMSLNQEGDIPSVAQFVSEMPATYPESTLQGNAGVGAGFYEVCVACHGADGRGNPDLRSPPIVQMHDWYLLNQLRNFKAGMRGADPADIWGSTMRPNTLAMDEQAMRDVIAYVQTLR